MPRTPENRAWARLDILENHTLPTEKESADFAICHARSLHRNIRAAKFQLRELENGRDCSYQESLEMTKEAHKKISDLVEKGRDWIRSLDISDIQMLEDWRKNRSRKSKEILEPILKKYKMELMRFSTPKLKEDREIYEPQRGPKPR